MKKTLGLLKNQEVRQLRSMFPALQQKVHGHPLAYLDNAATTQKPHVVIDGIADYYRYHHANVHRTTHYLAYQAEKLVEEVREQVVKWLNATQREEIIFTTGTTGSLNLVAESYGRHHLQAGDQIIISALEHHSNVLPWQRLCAEKGCKLDIIPIDEQGSIQLSHFKELLSPRTRLVSITHVSHVTGKTLPIEKITQAAHQVAALVVLDAAQSAPHIPLDVQSLDVDFLAFSAHKIYGPTGIGILYGRRALLEKMKPYQVGGGMIRGLRENGEPYYEDLPHRLEAGTLPIASIIGLGKSLDFLSQYPDVYTSGHTRALCQLTIEHLQHLHTVTPLGKGQRTGILSFNLENAHPLDVATHLDLQGIAIRSGLQCAAHLMHNLRLSGTIRASFAMYNTVQEVERLVNSIATIKSSIP